MTRRPRLHLPAFILAIACALGLGVVLVPTAQSQIRATPSYTPVGVSASGNGSTAWFHDASTGRAIACHLAAGPIQCQAVRLPEGS